MIRVFQENIERCYKRQLLLRNGVKGVFQENIERNTFVASFLVILMSVFQENIESPTSYTAGQE